jgi:predicted metal-dependent HD superfamily phosphohydrolase
MNATDATAAKPARPVPDVGALCDRFLALWLRNLPSSAEDRAEPVWRVVAANYSQPHRHYHDLRHLAHCLRHFDTVADRLTARDEVEMAIWFHDVILEPGRADNERRSADYFREVAGAVMPAGFVTAVVDLILFTTHRTTPADLDHQFICDIDLSSFGSPWEAFLANSRAIEAEFSGPREEYVRRETSFLECLLRRPRIFMTDFFHDLCEEMARDNIRRFLQLLPPAGRP